MRRFVQRALGKLGKLDHQQLHVFIQDLAKENDRLETLLDSLSDGILVCDKDNMTTLVNKAAERLIPLDTSRSGEQVLLWELILDPQLSAFVQESLIDQETIDEAEFAVEGGTKTRILSIRIAPLVSKGRITGSVMTINDISEKRLKEVRLKRAESLAKLSTVAAGVAHEIKNPLGAISIHIQLIQRLLATQPCSYPNDVNNYLDVVTEEIERLNRIVVDFLFAVRPMDLQLLRGSVVAVVNDILQFMKPELEQEHIKLVYEEDPSMPDILLDERYMKQAILNVVKNAVHAMPQGGTLWVSCHHGAGQVVIDVRDSGVGMSQDVMDKIFEPFFTTRDFGNGIGLTLVYKIVREHGGEIGVESQEGLGARFSLSFPPYKEGHQLLAGPSSHEKSQE